MAPPSKDGRIRLLEPLATDFAAFRVAIGMGATEIGVIREAVRALIEDRIAKDRHLRQRYEEERDRLRALKVRPLRVVKSDTTSHE